MKVAVCYEDGEVFQHFGETEQFKIYDIDVEKRSVASSKIIGTDGRAHLELIDVLKENGVNVLICGNICGNPRAALARAGIKVFPGVLVDADTAVDSYLLGTLVYDNNASDGEGCCCHGCE